MYFISPVFENSREDVLQIEVANYLRIIYDSLGYGEKLDGIMRYLALHNEAGADIKAMVSQLNGMFQSYLLEKQEADSVRARKEDVKKAVRFIVPLTVLMALAIIVFAKQRSKKLLKEQQDEAIQQARMMLPQRVNDLYRSKVSNRMERILEEFEAAYPYALERLAAAYPDLNKTETYLVVLSFLQFRAKEEADLPGLSENTVMQYRSNLRKKTANASFSEFFN